MAGTASRRGLIARQYSAQPGFEEKEVTETLEYRSRRRYIMKKSKNRWGVGTAHVRAGKVGWKGGRVRTGCPSCALL